MLGIETSGDATEQRGEDVASMVRFGFEEKDGQGSRSGEDRALLRDPLVGRAGGFGRCRIIVRLIAMNSRNANTSCLTPSGYLAWNWR